MSRKKAVMRIIAGLLSMVLFAGAMPVSALAEAVATSSAEPTFLSSTGSNEWPAITLPELEPEVTPSARTLTAASEANGKIGADFSDIEMPRARSEYGGFISDPGAMPKENPLYGGFIANPKEDPIPAGAIHIGTAEELANIVKDEDYYGIGKYFMLDNDIDLSGAEWEPVYGFAGTLDGRGYSINGLHATGNGFYTGLFGSLFGGAQIKNLEINIGEQGLNNSGGSTGAIAGQVGMGSWGLNSSVLISNCRVTGNITAENGHSGGFIGTILLANGATGENGVTITNCVFDGTLRTDDLGGGLVGATESFANLAVGTVPMEISGCIVSGDISGVGETGYPALGGLVGYSGATYKLDISSCEVSGKIVQRFGGEFEPPGQFFHTEALGFAPGAN